MFTPTHPSLALQLGRDRQHQLRRAADAARVRRAAREHERHARRNQRDIPVRRLP